MTLLMSYNLSAEERIILDDPDNSGEELPQKDIKNKQGNVNANLTEDKDLTGAILYEFNML